MIKLKKENLLHNSFLLSIPIRTSHTLLDTNSPTASIIFAGSSYCGHSDISLDLTVRGILKILVQEADNGHKKDVFVNKVGGLKGSQA